MTLTDLRELADAAAEAWAHMNHEAEERRERYLELRAAGADPLELTKARLSWGVAAVTAAQLWVERCGAFDRLRHSEKLAGVG